MKRIASFYALFVLLSLSSAPGGQLYAQDKNIVKKDLLRQGNRMYKRAEYPLSDSLYATAVALDSVYAAGWYNLGNSLYSGAQSPDQAQAAWMQALSLTADEDRADILYNLGGAEMDRKNYAEAVKLYKDALRRNPSDEQARYNLALAQTLLKDQQQNPQNDQNQDQNQNNPDNNNDQNQDQNQNQNNPDNNNDPNQDQNQDQNNPDNNNDPNQDQNQNQNNPDNNNDPNQDQNQNQNNPDNNNDRNQDQNQNQNNPDNNNDRNQDQNQNQNNPDNNNDRNQDQNQNNPNNNPSGGGASSGQNTPQPLSQSDEQMLRAIDRQEQGTQEKVKGKKAEGTVILSTKDW